MPIVYIGLRLLACDRCPYLPLSNLLWHELSGKLIQRRWEVLACCRPSLACCDMQEGKTAGIMIGLVEDEANGGMRLHKWQERACVGSGLCGQAGD